MKVIAFFTSEKQLIRRGQEGNAMAQERIFKLHAPKMLSVCRQYIPHLEQAEEAMCNAFLKVFQNLKKYRGDGSFEGWIRRIVIREAISYLRKSRKMQFDFIEAHTQTHTCVPATNHLEVEELQMLIDSLPDGYRTVFVLYAIEGYRHEEIAKMLEISPGTSKSQLFKARKQLQQEVGRMNTYKNYTDEL